MPTLRPYPGGRIATDELAKQFVRPGECDRSLRDQVAPNPVMVANDTDGIEVRAVAQGVAVSDHDNVVVVFNRGSDGGINAEISCPSGNQEPIRRDLFRRACNSVAANGSFRRFLTTTSAGSRTSSGRNAQPGVCGSKSSPSQPQCCTKMTVPDSSRTLAASRLMRSMMP
jgi:hypothetical protein